MTDDGQQSAKSSRQYGLSSRRRTECDPSSGSLGSDSIRVQGSDVDFDFFDEVVEVITTFLDVVDEQTVIY